MSSHDAVLSMLGCADLSILIPASFLKQFELNEPGQYGMVCANVSQQVARLEAVGSGPFLSMKQTIKRWTEGGSTKPVDCDCALGYSNGQQIELLGPGKGTRLYSDAIPSDGTIKLHHVCVMQKGIDKIEARLNAAGFPTHVSLEVGLRGLYSIRVKYFDTREELGFFLEVGQYTTLGVHAPMGERLITGLANLSTRK